jgi:hypothetical protein
VLIRLADIIAGRGLAVGQGELNSIRRIEEEGKGASERSSVAMSPPLTNTSGRPDTGAQVPARGDRFPGFSWRFRWSRRPAVRASSRALRGNPVPVHAFWPVRSGAWLGRRAGRRLDNELPLSQRASRAGSKTAWLVRRGGVGLGRFALDWARGVWGIRRRVNLHSADSHPAGAGAPGRSETYHAGDGSNTGASPGRAGIAARLGLTSWIPARYPICGPPIGRMVPPVARRHSGYG